MSPHTPATLRILLLEDNPADAELIASTLRRIHPQWAFQRAFDKTTFGVALGEFAPDVVLSDHCLPGFNALEALRTTQRERPRSAFMLVTDDFEEVAAECLQSGAIDLVRKSDLSRLPIAIDSALESRAPLKKLSQRQLEVLMLLAGGYSTRAIAEELQVSIKTVETHRAQLMKRLGIRDLASLVRYSIRVGLVSAR